MINILKNHNIFQTTRPNAKCGEIYCHSGTEFTIFCAFCEIKSFDYEDFLLHFKNIHFENNLLKTEKIKECSTYLNANRNNENKEEECQSDDEFEVDYPASYNSEVEDNHVMKWESYKVQEITINKNASTNKRYKRPRETHIKKNGIEYKCENCSKIYKTSGSLSTHLKREHKSPDIAELVPVKCKSCEEKFSSQSCLDAHNIKKHNGIECQYCDKRFKTKFEHGRHVETHVKPAEKNYVCDFEDCEKRFYTKKAMKSHVSYCHKKSKNFVCDVCGYSCRKAEGLRVHYRTHTGEKPYECNMCGKRFAGQSMVIEHKAMHATARPHVCEVCGATFARQKGLYHHRFLHLSEKKFKCRICGNAYAQPSGLAGHMRKHKEEGEC